ncbi:glycosyltransferase family 61 protein [Tabrizicola sp. J26]|uniref:glycosyltransferase family 61 protein n=1 Tax=Alitabrizicola rongguiensis TaxID=2909234 RepID=UPI001F2BF5DC|nr:glycosyltransferase 61 family protein [Tabrizicola rongguiensis]MCF1708453.1 glycosyltransferase family 61 protein [Tabrizicola rongguiensis]
MSEQGLQDRITTVEPALILPERETDAKLATGVLDGEGRFVEDSRTWIRAGKATGVPQLSPGEPVKALSGRWLFGGHFRGHFGHFLVESTARLWALDRLKGQVDGILYLPFRARPRQTRQQIRDYEAFFRQLGVDVPIEVCDGAMRADRLYVPELGFGWLERYAGSPAYRALMRERFAHDVAPDGPEKLYVSRSRLAVARGGVLGETVIEENLARQGFEIFHPEKHPFEVQIARYKAARQIVGLDGSALHLAGFVAAPETRVAIILRRSKANVGDYQRQFRSFCGIELDVLDMISRDWVSIEVKRSDYRSIGELDFARLFMRLAELGYVAADFRPDLPEAAEILRLLDIFSKGRGETFTALG